MVDYRKSKLQNPTIHEVFEEWNDRRLDLHKISPSSHLRLKQAFRRRYAEFGQRRIKDISEDEVRDFFEKNSQTNPYQQRLSPTSKALPEVY